MTRIKRMMAAALVAFGGAEAALAQSAPATVADASAAEASAPVLAPAPAQLSAEDAARAAAEGRLTLIDVRTPEEWAKTGAPENAVRLDMYAPDFLPKLGGLIAKDPNKPIALLCATGGRSTQLFSFLRKQGVTQVYNIPEGVFGSRAGPGWAARGLPLVKRP